MKLFKILQRRPCRRYARGFTLAEMVITVGVFLFIFTGIWVAVQIFGLRIYTLAATKLVATAGGRQALNQIRAQIREGKVVYVGNCSAASSSSSLHGYSHRCAAGPGVGNPRQNWQTGRPYLSTIRLILRQQAS